MALPETNKFRGKTNVPVLNRDSQKPQRLFSLWIGVLIALLLYVSFGSPDLLTGIVLRFLIYVIVLLMNYFFDLYALRAAAVFICVDSVNQLRLWSQTGDPFKLAVVGMSLLTVIASAVIAYAVEEDRKNQSMLEWLSVTDGVTEIFNHRYFKERLDTELEMAEHKKHPLALCMLDIDQFKTFNDTRGHTEGDNALILTAQIIKNVLRKGDVVCRYGGDEFAVILPNSDPNQVVKVLEQVKAVYKERMLSIYDFDDTSQLSLSAGYSVFPDAARTRDELISQADTALYYAKSLGRDRIEQYQDKLTDFLDWLRNNKDLEGNLRTLLMTISAKDKYICSHSERVANYAVLIGRALKMTEQELLFLRIGALLHDIGFFRIPEGIYNKEGSLTEEEYEMVKKHSLYSAAMVQSLPNMGNIVEDIKHHHERFDGQGYPDGVGDREIPLGARIMAIADAFDAMQWDRPYRKAKSLQDALQELVDNSGTQFDPMLVNLFVSQIYKEAAG